MSVSDSFPIPPGARIEPPGSGPISLWNSFMAYLRHSISALLAPGQKNRFFPENLKIDQQQLDQNFVAFNDRHFSILGRLGFIVECHLQKMFQSFEIRRQIEASRAVGHHSIFGIIL